MWILVVITSIALALLILPFLIYFSRLSKKKKIVANLMIIFAFVATGAVYYLLRDSLVYSLIADNNNYIAKLLLGKNYNAEKLIEKSFELGNLEMAHVILSENKQLHGLAFKYIRANNRQFLKKLVMAGLSADVTDNRGYTPLHYLAKKGDFISANILMTAEPNILLTVDGMTAIDFAVKNGHKGFVQFLMEIGMLVNSSTIGEIEFAGEELESFVKNQYDRFKSKSPTILKHICETAPITLTDLIDHYWRRGCIRRHVNLVYNINWQNTDVFYIQENTMVGVHSNHEWMLCPIGMNFSKSENKCVGTPNKYSMEDVKGEIDDVNKQMQHRYSDWRLPTIKDVESLYYIRSNIGGIVRLRISEKVDFFGGIPHFWVSPCTEVVIPGHNDHVTYCFHCCSLSEAGQPALLGAYVNKEAGGNYDKFSLLLVRDRGVQ